MKDIKTVLMLVVPVLGVVILLLSTQSVFGPTDMPPEVDNPDGNGTAGGTKPLHDGPVPRSQWPKEPGAGVGPSTGLTPVLPREPKDGASDSPTLTMDELNRLLKLGDPESFRRIEYLLRHGLVPEPFRVAERLMEAMKEEGNKPAFIAKLLPLMKDERVRERIAADLLTNLAQYTDRNSLAAAIEVIGKVGTADNVAGLGSLARNQETQGARVQALYALAAIGGEAAAKELTGLLREQKDVTNTMKAIEKMKGPEMVTALATMTAGDQPPEIRLLGVQALGRSATTEEATKALLELRKEGGEVGRAAGLQFRYVRGKEAAAPFLEQIDDEKDIFAKAGMARAIGTMKTESGMEKLRTYLGDSDEAQSVRGASAEGLADSGDIRAVKPFKDILSNPKKETRLLENKVLRSLGTLAKNNRKAAEELRKQVLPVLKKRIADGPDDSNSYWRHIAVVSLERGAARDK